MTTVKPSLARRSATAAPIPREAPVTIAILLVSLVIFCLLMVSRQIRAQWEEARPFPFSDNHASSGITIRILRIIDGQNRRDAGVHAGRRAAQLYAGSRGSRPATFDRHRRGEAA